VAALMDLIAGDRREILLGLAIDDFEGFADSGRFAAHLALGAGLDPTWLDSFSEAVRQVAGSDQPCDFLDACLDLPGGAQAGERTAELVDPAWVAAIAAVPADSLDAIAGRWIDLMEDDLGLLSADEKPWIRELAGQLVRFARQAQTGPDVIFAWSL
jgi:hypothetical protein